MDFPFPTCVESRDFLTRLGPATSGANAFWRAPPGFSYAAGADSPIRRGRARSRLPAAVAHTGFGIESPARLPAGFSFVRLNRRNARVDDLVLMNNYCVETLC